MPFENGCEKWELKEENKAENQENMLNVLRNMEKHLKEMILMLEED